MPLKYSFRKRSGVTKRFRSRPIRVRRRMRNKVRSLKALKKNTVPRLPLNMHANSRSFGVLRYSDRLTLTTSTKTSAEYTFRLNSLYDPDYTSTGHQPYGHDTLATLFRNYKVHAVKMICRFRNITAGSADNMCYIRGVQETDTTTAGTTVGSQLRESRQYLKLGYLKPVWTLVGDGSGSQTVLKAFIPLKKYATSRMLDDDEYGAAFGANPTNVIWGIIGWAGETVSSQSVDVHVDLQFFCEFSNPIMLSQS